LNELSDIVFGILLIKKTFFNSSWHMRC